MISLKEKRPSSSMRSGIHGGYTLIEVLISLVVVGIGLLGLAGMQALGVNNNYLSYLRSIATIHTETMAEMMRANIAGVNANDYAANAAPNTINYTTITTSTAPVFDCRPDDARKVAFPSGGTACTPAQQAQADVFNWLTRLSSDLPAGNGTVVCNDSDAGADADPCTDGSSHTITVQWREKDREAGQTVVTKSFSTVFRP
jgi:type IV pilus assembly protein PilV